MTLATVQMEVKKFWRDRKETRDLMYPGFTKPGGSSSGQGQGGGRSRRQRKKDRKKSASKEKVSQVTAGGEKEKETYCFKCGETSHKYTECSKKDLKCKADPNSTSHADLACFYYRKAMGLPISTRPAKMGRRIQQGADQPPLLEMGLRT